MVPGQALQQLCRPSKKVECLKIKTTFLQIRLYLCYPSKNNLITNLSKFIKELIKQQYSSVIRLSLKTNIKKTACMTACMTACLITLRFLRTFRSSLLLFLDCAKGLFIEGAMKQGWGTCGTFKVINLTYLHVLRAGMVYIRPRTYLSYGYGLNRP